MGSPRPNAGVNNLATQNFNNYAGQQQQFQNAVMGGLGGAQGRSNQAFNAALAGYQGLLGPGGGVGLGGGGGVDTSAIAALSGPGNPWAGQLGNDVRARENSVLPGFYDRIKSEQTRLQNIQGGYNPGFTSQMAKLAREQAQQAQSGVLNTEIEIGKQRAAAQAAQAAFELQKQGMIANLNAQGAAQGQMSAEKLAQLRLAALGGIAGLRGQTPGEVGMYLQAGLGGLGQQGLSNQGIGQLMQYNQPSTPWWQNALRGGVGLASAFL